MPRKGGVEGLSGPNTIIKDKKGDEIPKFLITCYGDNPGTNPDYDPGSESVHIWGPSGNLVNAEDKCNNNCPSLGTCPATKDLPKGEVTVVTAEGKEIDVPVVYPASKKDN